MLPKKIYNFHPTFTEQGTYLTQKDIQKIKIGMTKSEILSCIESPPTLKNIFGSNTWYYVYHKCYNSKLLDYRTIILQFDSHDKLITLKILNNI